MTKHKNETGKQFADRVRGNLKESKYKRRFMVKIARKDFDKELGLFKPAQYWFTNQESFSKWKNKFGSKRSEANI